MSSSFVHSTPITEPIHILLHCFFLLSFIPQPHTHSSKVKNLYDNNLKIPPRPDKSKSNRPHTLCLSFFFSSSSPGEQHLSSSQSYTPIWDFPFTIHFLGAFYVVLEVYGVWYTTYIHKYLRKWKQQFILFHSFCVIYVS